MKNKLKYGFCCGFLTLGLLSSAWAEVPAEEYMDSLKFQQISELTRAEGLSVKKMFLIQEDSEWISAFADSEDKKDQCLTLSPNEELIPCTVEQKQTVDELDYSIRMDHTIWLASLAIGGLVFSIGHLTYPIMAITGAAVLIADYVNEERKDTI